MYKKSKVVKEIRLLMQAGEKYCRACEKVIKKEYTVQRWRKKYPRLDRYFKKLMDKREDIVVDAVEKTLEKRILEGKAAPVEIIFFLCNRRPEKWRNKHNVEHSGNNNETKIIVVNPKEKNSDEDKGLVIENRTQSSAV